MPTLSLSFVAIAGRAKMAYYFRFMRYAGKWEEEEYRTLREANDRFFSAMVPGCSLFRMEVRNEEGIVKREWMRRYL